MSLQLSCITKQSHVNIHRLIQLDIIYLFIYLFIGYYLFSKDDL